MTRRLDTRRRLIDNYSEQPRVVGSTARTLVIYKMKWRLATLLQVQNQCKLQTHVTRRAQGVCHAHANDTRGDSCQSLSNSSSVGILPNAGQAHLAVIAQQRLLAIGVLSRQGA